VGSVIGNWLSGPLFGVRGSVQEFSLTGLVIAFVGAVVLLGIFNLVQRKSPVRSPGYVIPALAARVTRA
jgi:uncharacterized membrane protein YeaQ/YmgE (transglycosylase-associated protein family)